MAVPGSLQALQAAQQAQRRANYADGVVHIQTDDGDTDFDLKDVTGPGGRLTGSGDQMYNALLAKSADRRIRMQREASDAADPSTQIGSPTFDGGAKMATDRERGRSDFARHGYNAQWAPFFESFNVAGDNTGMKQRVDVGSMDLPSESSAWDPAAAVMPVRKGGQAPSMRALSKVAGY